MDRFAHYGWPFFEPRHLDLARKAESYAVDNLAYAHGEDADAVCRRLVQDLGCAGFLGHCVGSPVDVRSVALLREVFAYHAGLADTDWTASVRSAQGRTIPTAEVPWMRVREVWLHAHDIRAGATTDPGAPLRLPDGMAEVLLDDVTAVMSAREGCPSLLLRSPDGRWRLGRGEPDAVLDGSAGTLAGWLTGRGTGGDMTSSTGTVPEAPRWL